MGQRPYQEAMVSKETSNLLTSGLFPFLAAYRRFLPSAKAKPRANNFKYWASIPEIWFLFAIFA
jgi:hypothetical protein